jgi:tetratricopeptide (TPR) repeat protein
MRVALVAIGVLTARPSAAALSEAPRLAAIYDAILSAQFDRATAMLRDSCPPAPAQACQTLAVVSLWWQILVNPESRLLDQRLNDAAAAAIADAAAWTRREPDRAEAWFYLAGAYGPLVQWRVLRGERLAAAREGKKIKDALERALRLDPALDDAYFGVGLYHYYAAVAPAYAKVLRWLLWLPGGDRAAGLREMERARDRGTVLAGEADYQLHLAYLWYEGQPRRALDLLVALDARYPTNPLFLQRIAEVRDEYFHDAPASAAAYRELLARAHAGAVHAPRIVDVRARLGLAAQLIAMGARDEAIEQAQIVIDRHPIAPSGARARAIALLRAARARKNF